MIFKLDYFMQQIQRYFMRRRFRLVKRTSVRLKSLGFSALELMFVLAVIAVATVAIVRTMGTNSDSVDASNMVEDVSGLVDHINSAYASSSTGFEGLNNEVAISLKVVPTDLPINGSMIKNQFPSGLVTIEADASGDFFTITYTNVPSSVCQQVITQLGGSSFQTITVGSTILYDAVNEVALNTTEIGSACSSNSQNTMIFAAS